MAASEPYTTAAAERLRCRQRRARGRAGSSSAQVKGVAASMPPVNFSLMVRMIALVCRFVSYI